MWGWGSSLNSFLILSWDLLLAVLVVSIHVYSQTSVIQPKEMSLRCYTARDIKEDQSVSSSQSSHVRLEYPTLEAADSPP